ncbi:hypothetical protein [Allosphingosinicella sp.]|uniref:hypothetical protein n=1 Tax=Allosphingosinicella sp. TaxID=2823234 RepID=UPI00378473BA
MTKAQTKKMTSKAVPQPDRELYLNGRGVRAAQLGPYDVPVRIRTRAYGFHRKTGDNPKASVNLLYNGTSAGKATDANFDLANLQVVCNIILDPKQIAAFAVESGNSGATERYVGLEFWLSAA